MLPARVPAQAPAVPATTQRRWNGFVCPSCRSLFRVASGHDGRGVVCPACRRMLRLPEEGEETPPLVVDDGKGALRRRRRHSEAHREKRAAEIFDETFARKTGPDPIFARMLVAAVVTIVLVLVAGLLWPRGERAPEPVAGARDSDLPEALRPVEEEEDEVMSRILAPATVRDELEPVVRSYLEAPDLEAAAEFVAHRDLTQPRMREHYGQDYRPLGLRGIDWSGTLTRGRGWASFRIETNDFETRTVFLIDDGGWKLDWESWAGWSPMTWEELRAEQPTETIRVRARVRPTEYYNFGFAEADWHSVMLAAPDDENAIYGYVPAGSELHTRLNFLDGVRERRLLLDIRYPENAPIDNQVFIEAVVGEDWLDTDDLK